MAETTQTPNQPTETAQQQERPRVMVIYAHPDDAEFTCAGTVARFVQSGYRVQYVLATSGDKGSADRNATPEGLVAIREAEQQAAAQTLGVEEVTFLRHHDGEVEVSIPFRRQLAYVIRQGRPDVVLTFDPWQRYQIHPDHRAVGQTALDAVAAARDPMYYPEQLTDGLTEHRAHNVYFFATDQPNYYVDITATIEQKIAAVRCHTSQISGGDVADRVRTRARIVGQEIGVEYGEAFHYLPMMQPPALRRHPTW
ncbi:MAG TPA: PIG-L deacetylase family protein [Ktedonobacterales bacterium]|nr:PIG-L deacetylase family protein [Ktedonobacterales bacterium]